MKTKNSRSPFETLSSIEQHSGRFTIVTDQVRVNETEQTYDYLRIRPGVCILAEVEEQIVLQRQYRYPLQSWQWEMPGGFIDDGETPEQAAEREFMEETGYRASTITPLGFFYPSFGSTNEQIFLFHVCCGEKLEARLEPGEVIRGELVSGEVFAEMVADGRFFHGAGLAAWARWTAANKRNQG